MLTGSLTISSDDVSCVTSDQCGQFRMQTLCCKRLSMTGAVEHRGSVQLFHLAVAQTMWSDYTKHEVDLVHAARPTYPSGQTNSVIYAPHTENASLDYMSIRTRAPIPSNSPESQLLTVVCPIHLSSSSVTITIMNTSYGPPCPRCQTH